VVQLTEGGDATAYSLAAAAALIEKIDSGHLEIATGTVPLREVESSWSGADAPGERIVIVP
jgi:hypothetical protein